MNTPLLTEALNDCIDRLANGQSIEQCLRAYPELADQLRPLLQIGQASSSNRADAQEMSMMRARLDTQIETLITQTDFDSPTPFRLPQGVTVLIASLVVVVIGVLVLFSGGDINVGGEGTETPTLTPEITVEASPTQPQTPSVTPETPVEPSPTMTEAPSQTPTEVSTDVIPSPSPIVTDGISQSADCMLPDEWAEYRVQSGDTLSSIALNSGSTIEELTEVNCLEEAGFIVEGQTLFVPTLWQINPNNGQTTSSGSSNNSGSSSQQSDDDDSDDDDSDDSDDDDDDDDSDDSDNSGRGSNNSGSSDDDDDD